MTYTQQRIRVLQDVTRWTQQGTEVLTGDAPQFANGCSVQFEFAFTFGELTADASFIDMAQFASLTLDVKRLADRTASPLMSKTVAAGSVYTGLTKEEWEAGTLCHVAFAFTQAETEIFIANPTESLWLVVSGTTVDSPAKTVPMAAWIVTVIEDGAGVALPAGVVTPLYYTTEQSDARYLSVADLSDKLSRDGSLAMTGNLTLANSTPSNALHAASKGYVDAAVSGGYLPLSGGVMTGLVTLSGAPSSNLHAATKLYVDTADALALPKAGGTLTGALTLSGSPTLALHAATKAYADLMLPLAGGTMTGALTLSGAPTVALHAATKAYVDAAAAAVVGSAPSNLDTLEELAAAIGDDAAFATTMSDALALKLNLAGGTMTGALVLSGAPTLALHASTKAYVDAAQVAAQAASVPLAGGAMTGALTFSGTTHLGLRVLNIASAYANAVTATNGSIYYDSTANRLMAVEGGLRKWLFDSAAGGGTTWHNQSGAFSGGSPGSAGDYGLDTDTGAIYLNTGGTWGLLQAPPLPIAGGTLTGALVLAGAPTLDLHAATKKYVDDTVTGGGSFVATNGSSTMTGNLVFAADLAPAIDFGTDWLVQTGDSGAELQFNCGVEGLVLVNTGGSQCDVVSRNGHFNIASPGYGYQWGGVQVVGAQQSAITHPAETGSAEDSVARAAINNILAAMEAHGLIASTT